MYLSIYISLFYVKKCVFFDVFDGCFDDFGVFVKNRCFWGTLWSYILVVDRNVYVRF